MNVITYYDKNGEKQERLTYLDSELVEMVEISPEDYDLLDKSVEYSINGAHHKALQLLQQLHDKEPRNHDVKLKMTIELSFLDHDIQDYKGWHTKGFIANSIEAINALEIEYGDNIPFEGYLVEDFLKENYVCTLDFEELDDYLTFGMVK